MTRNRIETPDGPPLNAIPGSKATVSWGILAICPVEMYGDCRRCTMSTCLLN